MAQGMGDERGEAEVKLKCSQPLSMPRSPRASENSRGRRGRGRLRDQVTLRCMWRRAPRVEWLMEDTPRLSRAELSGLMVPLAA